MTQRTKKRILSLIVAAALAAATVAGCSILLPKRKVGFTMECKCPNEKSTINEIPEIMMV